MEPDREEQLEAIFTAAVEHQPNERGALLAAACGDDAMLREEIDALLVADAEATDFLETPPFEVDPALGAAEAPPDLIGRDIGRYRVRSIIASGGMGTVYEATQEKPHRTVALKVMRPGIASPSALRRFEHEPELLARLRHPGIAQVYDAGTYDDGGGAVPYFAMEYVPAARPILEYGAAEQLSIRARLELFARVCDAVHHGHEHGIVHRDLKPGNILVDTEGRCRVIDFGVARSTDADLAATTCQTEIGALIGTVRYMSPEQFGADPRDIDARSDVYALGVVLYELLCGHSPYEVGEQPVFEWARIVREHDPLRPSAIERALRGDVETIVLTALEKGRERRYQSAAALGRDIERHLGGEPIAARRHGRWRGLRSGLRRHRLGVVIVAAVLVLVAVTVSMLVRMQLEDAHHAELAALADELAPIYLQLAVSGPQARTPAALDDLSARIHAAADRGSPADANLWRDLGAAFRLVHRYTESRACLERAFGIHHRRLGDRHPETLRTMSHLSATLMAQWELPRAERLIRRQIEGWGAIRGEHDEHLLFARYLLGVLMQYGGRLDEAEAHLRGLLEKRERLSGPDHRETLAAARSLGLVLEERGRLDEADKLMRKTERRYRELHGAEDVQTMSAVNVLGGVLLARGALVDAERLFVESRDSRAKVLGPHHPSTLTSGRNVARALLHQGRLDEAAAILPAIIAAQDRVLPPPHPEPVRSREVLARVRLAQGRVSDARAGYRAVVEAARAVYEEDHWRRALYEGRYGRVLFLAGAHDEAEERLRSAHARLAVVLGAEHARTREIRGYLDELSEPTG